MYKKERVLATSSSKEQRNPWRFAVVPIIVSIQVVIVKNIASLIETKWDKFPTLHQNIDLKLHWKVENYIFHVVSQSGALPPEMNSLPQ